MLQQSPPKATVCLGLAAVAVPRNLIRLMMRPLLALIFTLQAVCALDFSPLEQVPVQEGGRKKPYLVFAQESLLGLTGKTAVKIDDRQRTAMDIITTLWLNPGGWDEKQLLLVNHKPLKDATGLDASRKFFSYRELVANDALVKLLAEAQALRARPGNQRLSGLPKEAADVGLRMAEFESLVNGSAYRFVANPNTADGPWSPAPPETLEPLRTSLTANDAAAFGKAVQDFRTQMAAIQPQFQPSAGQILLETWYQKSHPFGWAWKFYLAAGLVLLLWNSRAGYVTTWVLASIGLAFQVAGFVARTLISGRAPVTNMYESIIWVAFGTVLFALIFEAIYRSKYFLLGALPVAVVSLILADTQPVALNPGINPLVPVLRDNFWLSTHVTTITLSYAAFLLALGIGHITLGKIIGGKKPSGALYNYLYRVLQVGVFLLAVGTILGAVWANYSWGRFWDWDPKETWALVTLLGYLFVLHGRIAGKWGGFGLSVGAVLCFLCVLMAWYGVNFVLGAGLHSYGFGSGGFGYAAAFVVVELIFVAIAIAAHLKSAVPKSTNLSASETHLVS
jgi:ABC-type transport system involved in cytochrome c biogenesis permease subunit